MERDKLLLGMEFGGSLVCYFVRLHVLRDRGMHADLSPPCYLPRQEPSALKVSQVVHSVTLARRVCLALRKKREGACARSMGAGGGTAGRCVTGRC